MKRWSLSAASYGALFGLLLGIPVAVCFAFPILLQKGGLVASAGLAEEQIAKVAGMEISMGKVDAALETLSRIRNPLLQLPHYQRLAAQSAKSENPELLKKLDSQLQSLLEGDHVVEQLQEAGQAELETFDDLDLASREYLLYSQLVGIFLTLEDAASAESALAKSKDAAFRYQAMWSPEAAIKHEKPVPERTKTAAMVAVIWPICLAFVGFVAAGLASPLLEAFSKGIIGRALVDMTGSDDFREALGLASQSETPAAPKEATDSG